MSTPDPPRSLDSEGRRLGRILVEEAAIERRLAELAQSIRRELPDDEPLLIGLLTGSFVFVADLARALVDLPDGRRAKWNGSAHTVDELRSRLVQALELRGRAANVQLDARTSSGQPWVRLSSMAVMPPPDDTGVEEGMRALGALLAHALAAEIDVPRQVDRGQIADHLVVGIVFILGDRDADFDNPMVVGNVRGDLI